MTPEKNKLLFSALLFVAGLFFYTPLKADSIPAVDTGQVSYQVTCTGTGVYGNGSVNTYDANGSFNSWYVPCANGTAKQGSFEVSIYTYLFDKIGAGGQSALNLSGGGTYARFSRTLTSNGSDAGFSTYHSTGNYTVQTSPLYTCPDPNYPILNGNQCESAEPPSCDEVPILSAVTNFSSLCVTVDTLTGTSCSYEQIENSFGALSGTFLPNGSACECADSPDGQCYTPQEPPFPEGEECGVFGNYVWCSADPSQCESTLSAGGGVIPCGNCGTVNDTFMCIAGDAPEAERCSANDSRPECLGASEGDCPTGFQCDPPEANTDDTENRDQPACTLGDTRPECAGIPEGQPPTQSEETAQLEQLNSQMDDLRSGVGELNKTAKEIRDRQLGEEDFQPLKNLIEASEQQYQSQLEGAVASTEQQDELLSFITSEFQGTTGTVSGYLLPQLGCTTINIPIPNSSISFDLPLCEIGELVRPILAWIFALLTIARLFSIAYSTLTAYQIQ